MGMNKIKSTNILALIKSVRLKAAAVAQCAQRENQFKRLFYQLKYSIQFRSRKY